MEKENVFSFFCWEVYCIGDKEVGLLIDLLYDYIINLFFLLLKMSLDELSIN